MKYLNITPGFALVIASILALVAFAISTAIALNQPWLGISLISAGDGLQIEAVDENGPSAGVLYAGDIIKEIAGVQGNSIRLQRWDIVDDPDTIPTLAERNVHRKRQTKIHHILQQPVLLLTLNDGRTVRVQPQPSRPISSFSLTFWLLSFYATSAMLVGAAIWAVKQQTVSTRYLLLAGLGSLVLLNSAKIITLRELALDGALYPWLTFFYHSGNNLFALGMLGLILHFPKDLQYRWAIPGLMAYMAFFTLNENFEWTELPGNTVLIQIPLYMIAGIVFTSIQWFKSKNNPLDRAAIKILILLVWVLIIFMSGYYFTSVIRDDVTALGLNGNFLGIFSVFIFLSLSVIRYRLFDIDRWWFEVWLWFFAGTAIVAVDLVLISLIGFAPSYALVIAVIIAAWFYFPLRQWLWGKMFHRSRQSLDDYVPLLIGYFVQAEHADAITLWKRVLSDIFRPLSVAVGQKSVRTAEIGDNGTCMFLPCLEEKGSIRLYYADKGRRLFNSEDIHLAQALFNISKSSMVQRESYAKGVRDERKRIMRDLHDDVGGRLLTLTHSAHGRSGTAAEALKSLREIIYALDTEQHATLNAMIARWRIEVLERCELADIALMWEWDELDNDIELSPRQVLNLTLILREVMSNVFMHARASRIEFEFRMIDDCLNVRIQNDGVPADLVDIKEGKGLKNMRQRSEELGGEFRYYSSEVEFALYILLPLSGPSGV